MSGVTDELYKLVDECKRYADDVDGRERKARLTEIAADLLRIAKKYRRADRQTLKLRRSNPLSPKI